MSYIIADRVKETTTVTGTGAATLLGAATQFKAFSDVCANGDTAPYAIVGQSGTEWEVGIGTWATGGTLTRTTVLSSSNAGSAVSFSAGTKDVFLTIPGAQVVSLAPDNTVLLPIVSSNPSSAPTDKLYFYARKVGGRVLPKWMPPSGVDNPVQPALFGNNIILWTPATGTTVTGGFGTTWTKGGGAGTVSTPTLSTSAPTFMNSMKRTRHANAVTTTNQAMGIINTASGSPQFWRGNASGLGGFYFFTRFGLGIWLAGSRIFAGMTPGTAEVVTSDTIANNTCGLSRLAADTGNTLSFVTRDGSTTNTISISGATIATGAVFDVYIYAKPNDSTIYFRVDEIDNGSGSNLGTLIDSSTGTNLPTSTTFLGPQVEMSNGTANIVANTVAIDVNRIYVESDH